MINRRIKESDVVEVLTYVFATRGEPDYIRNDNGPEFASKAVTKWLEASGVETSSTHSCEELTGPNLANSYNRGCL